MTGQEVPNAVAVPVQVPMIPFRTRIKAAVPQPHSLYTWLGRHMIVPDSPLSHLHDRVLAPKNDQVTWLNLDLGQSGKDLGDLSPRGGSRR